MILDNRLDRTELERISLGFEHNVLVGKKKYEGSEIYLDHDSNDHITEEGSTPNLILETTVI